MNNYWIYIDFGILIVIFLFTLIILFYKKIKEDKLMDYLVAIKYKQTIDWNLRVLFGDGNFHQKLQMSNYIVGNFKSKKNVLSYLIKYFNFVINDETLTHLSNMYIVQKKAEQAINGDLYKKRIVDSITPSFTMYYESPQGNSYHENTYFLDTKGLKDLYIMVKAVIETQNYHSSQRNAMTPEVRNSIIRRDNWTCQRCGNSVYKEPNLLLEVDHIIPISKGGKTEPNNLQTLCWKCNRSKSDKIFSPNKDDNGNKKVVFPDDSFVDEEQNVVFPDDNVF